MEIEYISTPNAPKPAGHYSQAVVYDGLVYVAGQLAIDPATTTTYMLDGGTERVIVVDGAGRRQPDIALPDLAGRPGWTDLGWTGQGLVALHTGARKLMRWHDGTWVEAAQVPPLSLAFAPRESGWVVVTANNVAAVVEAGEVVAEWRGPGDGDLGALSDVAVDAAGRIVVTDFAERRVVLLANGAALFLPSLAVNP